MGARSWHKGRKAGDEIGWTEQDVRGAVAGRILELVDDLAGGVDREAIEAQGRPGDVTA